jgi:hypothetical protein
VGNDITSNAFRGSVQVRFFTFNADITFDLGFAFFIELTRWNDFIVASSRRSIFD